MRLAEGGGYVVHHNRKETKIWCDLMWRRKWGVETWRGVWDKQGAEQCAECVVKCKIRYRLSRDAQSGDLWLWYWASFRRGLMLREITNCSNRDCLKGMFRVTNKCKMLVEKSDTLLHDTWGAGRSGRAGCAAARLLGLWVRISPAVWKFVSYGCCVLSGRGLCDRPILRSEESYRV